MVLGDSEGVIMQIEDQRWGTWRDAEGWCRDALKDLPTEARLAWLEDLWRLRQAVMKTDADGLSQAATYSRASRL